MADITKFIGDKSREETIIDQFFRLAKKCKSKQEMRKLEQSLLKPIPIPPFEKIGEGKRTDFSNRSIVVAFPDKKYIKRLKQFMRINTYKGNNTWDTAIFVELLDLLESGRLKFDHKNKKFIMKTKKGKEVIL